MKRFLANETLVVAILTVVFAGDFYRNLITVPGWLALAIASGVWGILVVVTYRVSWRILPITALAALAWITISPFWSPYAPSSWSLTVGFLLTVGIGIALSVIAPFDVVLTRIATALRWILGGSIVFEVAVALSGKPLFPVGMATTPHTSIELAWSRALFLHGSGRVQGLVGNANLLAMLALLLVIIALVRLAASRRWGSLHTVDLALSVVVLAKTTSTTVFLAFAAVLGVWLIAWLARRATLVSRSAIVVLILGALGVVIYAVTHWTAVATRLGKSPDLTHRFDIWNAVLERIQGRPITGYGFVGWWPSWDPWFHIHSIRKIPVAQAHNVWLDLTMQVGLIGALLVAVAFASTVWMLFRLARREWTVPSLIGLGMIIAIAVQSLTESRLLSEWGIALFIVLTIVAHRRAEQSAVVLSKA